MSLTVWVPHIANLAFIDELRAGVSEDVTLLLGSEPPDGATAEVLVAGRPTPEQLDASTALRAVVIPYAGVPEPTRQLIAERPALALYNLHHNAAPTAEHAIALLLAAAKSVVATDRRLRDDHDWRRPETQAAPRLLAGRTVMVLGFGAIGRRVGRACHALGMTVLGVRRTAPPVPDDPDAHAVYGIASLPELLRRADALVVCLPGTPETTGLIGTTELAALPTGALLVNIGRGTIVDEAALYDALRDGHLGGAGIDVWYDYPPDADARAAHAPASQPFWELPNVVMTPHVGGSCDASEHLRAEHLAKLLESLARGENPPNRVDVARGY